MIFHDRIPHEHKYIPFVLQMSVLLIHRSSRFNTEDPNTFTGPEFLSLSRDRLSHEPGKCLLKNMAEPAGFTTWNFPWKTSPVSNRKSCFPTWPCCGRVLDPRPTLMPMASRQRADGPISCKKKHAFWTEPKQPKMESGVCHVIFMSLSQCDVISNTDWWPLMTPDLSFGHLSATGSPFLLMTNTLGALRSLHESTVWMAISQILDDHVRWLKIQRPSNGKWMDMIWLDQCAVESQCMYKAKTVEIHLNAPYYIPGYPRYVYIVWYIIIIIIY